MRARGFSIAPALGVHSYLGLVPFLCLLEVLGSHTFVLLADITQGSREVRLGNVHVNLDVLFLNLGLELLDLLRK